MNERMRAAVGAAQDAFWEKIAEAYPEAKHGDFPPDATVAFDDACARAVNAWVMFNVDDAE